MQPLYTAETDLSPEDYKRYARRMQKLPVLHIAVIVIALIWILVSGAVNLGTGRTALGIFMLAVVAVCPVLYLIGIKRQVERGYEGISKAGGNRFRISFYEDHLETENASNHGSYKYAELCAVIDTEDDVYLEVKPGSCVIVQKKNCSPELLEFLRGLKK